MAEPRYFAIDLQLHYTHPLGALRPYFDALASGRAIASRCPTCQRVWFPPRLSCAQDYTDTVWTELSGAGHIVSVTSGESRLPLADATEHHTFALVALDGADNVAFGRVASGETTVARGQRVRLAKAPEKAPHPAQAAYFVADDPTKENEA
ncbi:MAG: Zn-ribbon domain-containing OB-fold protein [Acidiferrobacterales bacterium]